MIRVLVTGSREWTDRAAVFRALEHAWCAYGQPTVVHGAAEGADEIAQEWADLRGVGYEAHPARDHATPRDRNQYMVDLGAGLCLAFALRWASGTGMCARMARRAGIRVVDYGVSTAPGRRDR